MIPDQIGQQLHDRATRGESLSANEQDQLRRWYAHHDQAEMTQISAAPVPSQLADLQARVQQVTAQVVAQARRIEALTAEKCAHRTMRPWPGLVKCRSRRLAHGQAPTLGSRSRPVTRSRPGLGRWRFTATGTSPVPATTFRRQNTRLQ